MPRENLTAGFVKTAKAQNDDERTIYWDRKQPSFGLVVTANGKKSYCVQYRNAAGQSRRMTISGVLSPEEARKQARGYLGMVAREGDPLADRRAAIALERDSFQVVAEDYLGDRKGGAQLRSVGEYRQILD